MLVLFVGSFDDPSCRVSHYCESASSTKLSHLKRFFRVKLKKILTSYNPRTLYAFVS